MFKIKCSPFVGSLSDNSFNLDRDIRKPAAIKVNRQKVLSQLSIIITVLSDSVAIALAWIIAQNLTTPVRRYFILPNKEEFSFFGLIICINLCILFSSGIYGIKITRRNTTRLFKALCLAQVAVSIVIFLSDSEFMITRHNLMLAILAWAFTLILVNLQRRLLDLGRMAIRRKFADLKCQVLLLGDIEDTTKAKRLIDSTDKFEVSETVDLSIFRDPQKLREALNLLNSRKFDEIFFCSWEKIDNPVLLSWVLKSAGISWRILAVDLNLSEQCSEIAMLEGMPNVRYSPATIIGVDFWCKRTVDLAASCLLLTVFAIPLLIIAAIVRLDSPGAIFYKQSRVGLKGRNFEIWKFRTMVDNAHELQADLETQNEVRGGVLFKIKQDPRITRVGKFLRRYSLDELPQLINVLCGDMSLVGPRPLPLRDVAKLSPAQHLRHEVLPGITGLWQVSGRSDTDSEEIFNLDLVYIQNWSVILDWQIMFKTIQIVTSGRGAY